jgi:hypothetical protein
MKTVPMDKVWGGPVSNNKANHIIRLLNLACKQTDHLHKREA